MTERQKEQRTSALNRCEGVCAVCGGSIQQYGTPQYAHRIGQTTMNYKKYGNFYIDSSANGDYVCSLNCNHTLDISHNQGKVLETLVDILTYEINKFNGGIDEIYGE